eukprot:CAMPEP_0195120832 /NCGR_PEP_ID=MMETSP0448-20130528/122757_1 /TAXON_ID=66468 /ORGANISM="Heterocapsa triquestra, Strain CCMP 448" /LENGTH=232 /DNA_ID=CAMNT_0040158281 /DNA_START=1 /DNA_END=699 /DNA_ORIENTATION=+
MGNAAASGDCRDGFERGAPHVVRLAATEILKVAGMSGFHTSLIIDDRELFFDRDGIMAAPPLWSHLAGRSKHPSDLRTEVVEIGRSASGAKALVQALGPFFEKGTYDIFFKNCNSFTDAALYFLTRTRLDGHFSRIERLITATNPVSTSLLNRLFRAFIESNTGTAVDVDIYVTNPEADGFSVDDVIASFDEESESESEGESEESDSDLEAKAYCCYRPRPSEDDAPGQHAL